MSRHWKGSLPVETKRCYMHALRALLGMRQYDILRDIREERLIREAQVSAIEGKIGYSELWDVYAKYFKKAIEKSGHTDDIQELMRTLLQKWEEA